MSFAELNDDDRRAGSGGRRAGRGAGPSLSSGFPEDSYGTRGISSGPSTVGGGGGGGRAIIATDRYDEVVARIEKDLRELTRRLALIQSQVNLLGTPQDGDALRHNMNVAIKEAQQMAKNTNQTIKQLTKIVADNPSGERKQTEKRLKKDFQDWLKRFQSTSQQSTKKERQTKAPTKVTAQAPPIEEGPMSGFDDYSSSGRYRPEFEEEERKFVQVQSELDFNESLIADRETEIAQIEQSMAELNDIFRDLNAVVVDQQTLIDTIESNIDEAHQDVNQGVDELVEAKETQAKSKARTCVYVCIACVLVGILIAVIVIVVQITSSGGGSSPTPSPKFIPSPTPTPYFVPFPSPTPTPTPTPLPTPTPTPTPFPSPTPTPTPTPTPIPTPFPTPTTAPSPTPSPSL